MSLTREDVLKIAHLARLRAAEEDVPRYVSELSSILALVEQMNAVDTAGVDPMAHPLNMRQRLRPDEVTEAVDREALQALAPAIGDGLYLVPRVIE